MGLRSHCTVRDFWSTYPLMSSSIFQKTMTQDRFDSLTSAIHFVDNEEERQGDDRLWKVRPVLDVLDETFRTVFIPNKIITVDESLWAFKGRHHAVQYNLSKRARRGMKVYKLCSSDGPEEGYTSAFKIYTGQDRGESPASMKAVIDLLEKAHLFDKGYEMHSDRWYSSPTLFIHLQARKTSAFGTVCTNRRGMPADLRPSRGQIDFRSTPTGMMCLQWVD
ncbi:hypothetical protein C7M84_006773 [Penaeus vannamei]|uniref:PiggyBac transposable element-derived protein domain-containing protein n=1 Tax=Penaeus vannamei TaxID=6689 RepID=A0A423TE73_PENVA|nr:hypothetical protein C7M84_006773 [Penaeus vannamei]